MSAPLSPERLTEIAAGVSLPDRDDLRKLVADALSQHPNGWGVNRVLDLVDSVLAGATKDSDEDHRKAYRLLAEGFNERGADNARLTSRVAELEAERDGKPNRFTATPLQVDVHLRTILAEDTYLRYQQTIGGLAVEEAAKDIRMETASLKAHGVLELDKDWAASSAADHIDPLKGGGHYPSQLLCSQHNGFGPCPGAPWCTPAQASPEAGDRS